MESLLAGGLIKKAKCQSNTAGAQYSSVSINIYHKCHSQIIYQLLDSDCYISQNQCLCLLNLMSWYLFHKLSRVFYTLFLLFLFLFDFNTVSGVNDMIYGLFSCLLFHIQYPHLLEISKKINQNTCLLSNVLLTLPLIWMTVPWLFNSLCQNCRRSVNAVWSKL